MIKTLKKELSQIERGYLPGLQYIRVISYNGKRGSGIIRCDHLLVEIFRLAFKNMQMSRFFVKAEILGVSGTIKALKRKKLKFENLE